MSSRQRSNGILLFPATRTLQALWSVLEPARNGRSHGFGNRPTQSRLGCSLDPKLDTVSSCTLFSSALPIWVAPEERYVYSSQTFFRFALWPHANQRLTKAHVESKSYRTVFKLQRSGMEYYYCQQPLSR